MSCAFAWLAAIHHPAKPDVDQSWFREQICTGASVHFQGSTIRASLDKTQGFLVLGCQGMFSPKL